MSDRDEPTPDRGAIAFAERLMTVLARGRMTTTYKYAVLLGLIDVCHEQSTTTGEAPQRLRVADLAEKVIALYWPQTMSFEVASGRVLAQVSKRDRQAEILQLIHQFRERDVGDLTLTRTRSRVRCPDGYERLVREVEWKLAEMPIPKRQRVGDSLDSFIYEIGWDDGIRRSDYFGSGFDRSIHFVGSAGDHLVRLAALLRPVIQREWTHLVAEFNRDMVEEGRLETFLFDFDRASLASIRSDLSDLQDGRCFYCAGRITEKGEVDHFIPWSRYPNDALENLVAADAKCNNAKRDHLAGADHVESWIRRIDLHKTQLSDIAVSRRWEREPDRSLSVARSIYLRLPPSALLWRSARDFVKLDRPRLVRAFSGWLQRAGTEAV